MQSEYNERSEDAADDGMSVKAEPDWLCGSPACSTARQLTPQEQHGGGSPTPPPPPPSSHTSCLAPEHAGDVSYLSLAVRERAPRMDALFRGSELRLPGSVTTRLSTRASCLWQELLASIAPSAACRPAWRAACRPAYGPARSPVSARLRLISTGCDDAFFFFFFDCHTCRHINNLRARFVQISLVWKQQ